jgi:endonuclease/exonuclease/phosphatase family metal-dependent hydrolase
MANRSWFFAPFHQVQRPDRRYPYRQYGQLIASTCRLDHTAVIELPTVNPSTLGAGHILKRIALYAELPGADGRTIGIVNVHNEPFARRRFRQMQHASMLQAVDQRKPDVAICCGDFNPSLGQRAEPGLQLLEANGFENAFHRHWRVLDSCFARGHRGFTLAARLPLPGSDHRPIVARLQLLSESNDRF